MRLFPLRRTVFVLGAAWLLLAAALFAAWFFGVRAWRSYELLNSAVEIGLPSVANIRGWMTLGYVAGAYDVAFDALVRQLGLPADTAADTTLAAVGTIKGLAPLDAAREAQAAIAALAPTHDAGAVDAASEPSSFAQSVYSSLLAWRYPALAAVLLLGAVGLPVPTGFSTVLAGSMVAVGEMSFAAAAGIAVVASVIGDGVGYGIGHGAKRGLIDRYGPWMGLTAKSRKRVENLFNRWGGLTIFLTRTLVSHLSSVASLLAGVSRYPFGWFLAVAAAGRIVWTGAYLGLGYLIGAEIEAASIFLEHVSGLILSLGAVFIIGAWLASPLFPRTDAAADDA